MVRLVFVRKVRAASAAVAAQVMRKSGRGDEVVEHVGSAHTRRRVGCCAGASPPDRYRRSGCPGFRGVVRAVMSMMLPIGGTGTLRLAAGVPKGVPVASGRTTSTNSRLLYDVIGAIYDWVGFDVVDEAVLLDLVIARIVEPTNKVDSLRVLADLGADTVSYRTIQRHLLGQHRGLPRRYRHEVLRPRC